MVRHTHLTQAGQKMWWGKWMKPLRGTRQTSNGTNSYYNRVEVCICVYYVYVYIMLLLLPMCLASQAPNIQWFIYDPRNDRSSVKPLPSSSSFIRNCSDRHLSMTCSRMYWAALSPYSHETLSCLSLVTYWPTVSSTFCSARWNTCCMAHSLLGWSIRLVCLSPAGKLYQYWSTCQICLAQLPQVPSLRFISAAWYTCHAVETSHPLLLSFVIFCYLSAVVDGCVCGSDPGMWLTLIATAISNERISIKVTLLRHQLLYRDLNGYQLLLGAVLNY